MVYKNAIISLLSTKIMAGKPLTCTHFTKAIKAQKESIYHKDNMPGQNTAQIHGLALTLLAKQICSQSTTGQKWVQRSLHQHTWK